MNNLLTASLCDTALINSSRDTRGISESQSQQGFFENLPPLLKPEQVKSLLGVSIKTIYDWRYRGKTKNNSIPKNLFLKFNKKIFIRTEVLKSWIASQNP